VEILVRSKEFQVIVIDSLDYMMPRVELEGVIGESHMGKRGFLNGQAARKLVGPVRLCNTALIFVSQVRYKLGVLFGSPETMSGGQSIQHWCGLKIDMRGGKHIKDAAEEPIGQEVHIFIPWNKIARPFAKETLEFYFDGGFTKEPDILEYGAELGLFKKRSSYYYFTENEKEFVQGRAKAIQYLKNNPDVAESLEAQIRERMGGLRKEKGLEPDSEQGQESEPSA
jgi:recombination protein RecA